MCPIIIKAQNLDECFDKFDNFSSKDNDVSEDDLRDSRDFLKTIKNPEFETETIKIKDLGEFKIYLGSKREDGEQNIGLIRENMFICRLGDAGSFPYFHRITLNTYEGCNILVETLDQDAKDSIRNMEPPQHNKVEVDRIKDQEQKNIMMKGLEKFKDEFIEKIMKKYYAKEQREPEDLDIFDPWFQMEGDSDGSEDIDYTSGIRFLESKSKKQKSVFNEEEEGKYNS